MRRPEFGEVLLHARRSGSKQELGWKGQIAWGKRRSKELGVELVIPDDFDLDALSKKGLHQCGNVYFDSNISGGELNRPGFQAMVQRATHDMRVSDSQARPRSEAGESCGRNGF